MLDAHRLYENYSLYTTAAASLAFEKVIWSEDTKVMTLAIELAETLRVPMWIAEHALQEIIESCAAVGRSRCQS